MYCSTVPNSTYGITVPVVESKKCFLIGGCVGDDPRHPRRLQRPLGGERLDGRGNKNCGEGIKENIGPFGAVKNKNQWNIFIVIMRKWVNFSIFPSGNKPVLCWCVLWYFTQIMTFWVKVWKPCPSSPLQLFTCLESRLKGGKFEFIHFIFRGNLT